MTENQPAQGVGAGPGETEHRAMDVDPKLLESLVCPLTHGPLHYDRDKAELVSRKARLVYPIRDGIPILIESEARPLKDGE